MSPHNPTGFDVTRLVLTSGAGWRTASRRPSWRRRRAGRSRGEAEPQVRVVKEDATSMSLRVDDASKPFWLVLGQSYNKGWTAKVGGKTLAAPTLVGRLRQRLAGAVRTARVR